MENDFKPKVGIVISTMNRSDFVIRQLEYYAKVKSPHPVYIGDASNEEHKKKLQAAIEKLSESLAVRYYAQPEKCTILESRIELYEKVKEEYCAFSGDDDYQIPNSLTKCAEFLERNPDYSSASGHSVSFRLVNNSVYGELRRLADYPRQQIEAATAAQRLVDLMTKFHVTEFSVQKTKYLIEAWSQSHPIKDWTFGYDVFPSAISAISGKSKIVDCLSLIRQLDNPKMAAQNSFEWITKKDWGSSFEIFNEILAQKISIVDGIDLDKARKIPKQAIWSYLRVWLPYQYAKTYGIRNTGDKKPSDHLFRKLRLRLGQKLPWLKNIYLRAAYSLPNSPRKIYYEVMQPSFPYYEDFQRVYNSFTGKYRT